MDFQITRLYPVSNMLSITYQDNNLILSDRRKRVTTNNVYTIKP
jgi:hypothetical protein